MGGRTLKGPASRDDPAHAMQPTRCGERSGLPENDSAKQDARSDNQSPKHSLRLRSSTGDVLRRTCCNRSQDVFAVSLCRLMFASRSKLNVTVRRLQPVFEDDFVLHLRLLGHRRNCLKTSCRSHTRRSGCSSAAARQLPGCGARSLPYSFKQFAATGFACELKEQQWFTSLLLRFLACLGRQLASSARTFTEGPLR